MTEPPISKFEGSMSASEPNRHVINSIISTLEACKVSSTYSSNTALPRTELDSHANMVVLGKNAFIFESTGRTCTVKPFSDRLGTVENVPIVDAAIAYECQYTCQTYILIIRNALHIPYLDHNLVPPFILRAGGVIINDVPKIHCPDPSVLDHCISFPDSDLKIPLQLFGTFSYFHSRKPETEELYSCDKVFLTPDSSDWNPHCESYE
jgi:hypothetical protein